MFTWHWLFAVKFEVKLFFNPVPPCAARLSDLLLSKVRSEGCTSCSSVLQALILLGMFQNSGTSRFRSFFTDQQKKNHRLCLQQNRWFFYRSKVRVQSSFSFRRDRSYISKNLMANSLFAKVNAERRTSSLSGVTFWALLGAEKSRVEKVACRAFSSSTQK